MPFYDLVCKNQHEQLDKLLKLGERPPCPVCGEPTETLWTQSNRNILADGIPGGRLIYHGLCNPDGTPRRYDSRSEIEREAKKRGLVNHTDKPDKQPKKVYFT